MTEELRLPEENMKSIHRRRSQFMIPNAKTFIFSVSFLFYKKRIAERSIKSMCLPLH